MYTQYKSKQYRKYIPNAQAIDASELDGHEVDHKEILRLFVPLKKNRSIYMIILRYYI